MPVAPTNKVFLRTPRSTDEKLVRRAYALSETLHHPWTPGPIDFQAYLGQSHRYFVCVDDAVNLAGTFHISGIIRGGFHSAFLGYAAFVPYAGLGYMTRGMELLLERAFGELNLHRLEANIQPGNLASRRLVMRAGFIQEGYSEQYLQIGGQWCDHERWAIINRRWLAPSEF